MDFYNSLIFIKLPPPIYVMRSLLFIFGLVFLLFLAGCSGISQSQPSKNDSAPSPQPTPQPAPPPGDDDYPPPLPDDSKAETSDKEEDLELNLAASSATCSATSPAASGTINLNESLAAGSYSYKLIELTSAGKAKISVQQGGVERYRVTLAAGESTTLDTTADGSVKIKVLSVAPGYTFGAKWARLEVYLCSSSTSKKVDKKLDEAGEDIVLAPPLDIAGTTSSSPLWASLKVYENNKLVLVDVVPEGSSTTYKTYKVVVERVSPGYTFGAKWAKLNIYSGTSSLAKGTVNIGESLSPSSSIRVELTDLTIPYPAKSCAILSDYLLCSGSSVSIGSNTVELEKISPGYTFGAKWAKIKVGGSSKVLNVGESLNIRNERVTLNDLTISSPENSRAVFNIQDSSGAVLFQDSLNIGSSSSATIGGDTYTFKILKVAPGYTFGAKWANVEVRRSGAVALSAKAIVGQTLSVGSLRFVLTDLTIANPEKARASISVLDKNGRTLFYDSIGEGSSISVPGISLNIGVKKLAPGYSFGAKWARIKAGSTEGVLNVGEYLLAGAYKVRLDDITFAYPETARASLQFYSGSTLLQESTVQEGASVDFSGKKISVTKLNPGYSLTSKWVKIKVGTNERVVFIGESYDLGGGSSVRLADITTVNPKTSRASVRVNDASGAALYYAAINEGSSEDVPLGFKVQVKEVNPGYTFGAKWAKLKVGTAEGVVRVGEALNYGAYRVVLEDLTQSYK